jgi:hypothetical protein
MELDEARDKIVEALSKKKGKSKFYFNDLSKILELKPREAKKLVNVLVQENTLEYWSSGSTSMYGLKGVRPQRCRQTGRRRRRSLTAFKHP